MTEGDAPRPRGSFVLYLVAFGLMVAAGVALVMSAKGFLESTRLLWLSSGLSLLAVAAAIAALFVQRRR